MIMNTIYMLVFSLANSNSDTAQECLEYLKQVYASFSEEELERNLSYSTNYRLITIC